MVLPKKYIDTEIRLEHLFPEMLNGFSSDTKHSQQESLRRGI